MERYLTLLNFTQQGIQNIERSPERAAQFRKTIEAAGGKVLSQYWSLGEADGCVIFEVPNDSIATTQLLALAKLGDVRTRTMCLFDEHEFGQVVSLLK